MKGGPLYLWGDHNFKRRLTGGTTLKKYFSAGGPIFARTDFGVINLRQNTQKEKVLRELVERAGEAKGYRKRSKAPEHVLVLAGNSPVLQTLQL